MRNLTEIEKIEIHYVLNSNIDLVDAPKEKFLSFLLTQKVQEEKRNEWELIFMEMVINAIKHGNQEDSNRNVILTWGTDPQNNNRIFLRIKDEGLGGNVTNYENPKLPEDPYALNGRGIYMVQHYADQILYERKNEGGFQVTIFKQ